MCLAVTCQKSIQITQPKYHPIKSRKNYAKSLEQYSLHTKKTTAKTFSTMNVRCLFPFRYGHLKPRPAEFAS